MKQKSMSETFLPTKKKLFILFLRPYKGLFHLSTYGRRNYSQFFFWKINRWVKVFLSYDGTTGKFTRISFSEKFSLSIQFCCSPSDPKRFYREFLKLHEIILDLFSVVQHRTSQIMAHKLVNPVPSETYNR